MTIRYSSTSIPDQFSEFIRAEYPRFVEFLKAYYKFLDQETLIGNISSIKDIDATDTRFVANYRMEFAIDVPKFDFLETRRFILFAKALYEAKGTEDAIRFLHRAAFNTEISVDYPKDWILRASDGRWFQEHFIDVNIQSGTYDPSIFLTYDSIGGSPFYVEPIRSVLISEPNHRRFYFDVAPKFLFDGARVYQKNEAGIVIFFASLILTPNTVTIDEPGSGWKVGQLVKLPGSGYDTFVRVTKVNETGGVTKVETIEYGYEHPKEMLYVASPLAVDPANTSFSDPNTEYASGVDSHSLTLFDYIFNIKETVTGVLNSPLAINYNTEFDVKRTASPMSVGISMADWVASRAVFRLGSGVIGSNKGKWLTDDGHLSNDTFRLQDNFFYQVFSYLITTPVNSDQSLDIIKINHPAGLKFFTQLEFSNDIQISMSADRQKQRSTIYLYDSIDGLVDEINSLELIKPISDTFDLDDAFLAFEYAPSEIAIDTFSVVDASSVDVVEKTYVVAGYWDVSYTSKELQLTLT